MQFSNIAGLIILGISEKSYILAQIHKRLYLSWLIEMLSGLKIGRITLASDRCNIFKRSFLNDFDNTGC